MTHAVPMLAIEKELIEPIRPPFVSGIQPENPNISGRFGLVDVTMQVEDECLHT